MNKPILARAANAGEHAGGGTAAHSRAANLALGLGVCGVAFGFLLCFAVLTPAAIIYGVRGLREIHAVPELRGRGRALTGMGLAVIAPFLWVGVFVALFTDGVL